MTCNTYVIVIFIYDIILCDIACPSLYNYVNCCVVIDCVNSSYYG